MRIPRHVAVARHASNRLRERYGIEITADGIVALAREIKARRIPFTVVSHNRGSQRTLAINLKGRQVFTVFDELGGRIVTFLAPDQNAAHSDRTCADLYREAREKKLKERGRQDTEIARKAQRILRHIRG